MIAAIALACLVTTVAALAVLRLAHRGTANSGASLDIAGAPTAMVLPAEIETHSPDWAWLRLGAMDLIAVNGYYVLVSMVLNVAQVPLPEGETPPLKPL